MKGTAKKFFTISELAKILNISRVAVYKKIINGHLKAEMIGDRYLIPSSEVKPLISQELTMDQKHEIEAGVKRVIDEYGMTLRKLGKE